VLVDAATGDYDGGVAYDIGGTALRDRRRVARLAAARGTARLGDAADGVQPGKAALIDGQGVARPAAGQPGLGDLQDLVVDRGLGDRRGVAVIILDEPASAGADLVAQAVLREGEDVIVAAKA